MTVRRVFFNAPATPEIYTPSLHDALPIFGWSLLPDTMTENSLSILNVDVPPVTRELGYITHKERTLSNAARHFIQLLEQAAEKGS